MFDDKREIVLTGSENKQDVQSFWKDFIGFNGKKGSMTYWTYLNDKLKSLFHYKLFTLSLKHILKLNKMMCLVYVCLISFLHFILAKFYLKQALGAITVFFTINDDGVLYVLN